MAEQETKNTQPQQQDATPAKDKAEKKAKKPKGDAAKLAAVETQLAEAEQEKAQLKDQWQRTAAEYDNYRRRTEDEKKASFSHGVAHAAEQLLPVLDTLEMAAGAPTADEEYKKGVVLTLSKAQEVFKKLGIEEIDAQGNPFDPELHNACMQEACEGVEAGCVTKVMQKGYTLNGKVIRHAVVAVSP